MSPRTGRPTDDPKTFSTRVRMSADDIKLLEYCCQKTGKTKADVIRAGIKRVYESLQVKK